MPIKILAREVISKIAAGEVVERPASVVKELVENALDAGATHIAVEAQGGGVSLIRVTDNGSGISASDVELAFHRYATSKIGALTDLEKIYTLGFRGEALPSIATVAEVEVLTKSHGDTAGTYLYLKNGKVLKREKRSRPQGTTVTAHRLFRNFPARLKFLKSATTENGHIANLLSQYAMAFPEVKFNLVLDGRLTLRTPGNGSLRDVVAEVYGLEIAKQMLEIDGADQSPGATGLVSPPSLSRSSRGYLSFFVNRRWVRSSLLARASEDAYHGLLMTGKHPIVVLNISLPPQELDINVHPTKTEVKFRNSQTVYTAIQKSLGKVLAKTPPPEIKACAPAFAPPPSLWEPKDTVKASLPILRVVGQLASNYILAEGPEGLYLIDQHAAHERVLFEKILAQRSQQKIEVQGLLEPMNIELSPKQEETLKTKSELLNEFGFSLESFGDRSYLLRAVPAMMKEGNLTEAVKELLDSLTAEEELSKREEKIAQSVACHSAIKAGDSLTSEEMRELIKQLEQTKQPRNCPHGRPTMIHLSSHQLEKEFGRIS
ncbi:MAG: DNA mismatch repair endonuclease MutL [Dehalococcoidia bacterium]|nr:DNA mismatch repair endonuclease MutL [Dehalococcoidia bacterium]